MAPRQYARLNNQKQNDPVNWPFFIFQFFICIFALRAVSVSFAHHESKNFKNKGRNLIYSKILKLRKIKLKSKYFFITLATKSQLRFSLKTLNVPSKTSLVEYMRGFL